MYKIDLNDLKLKVDLDILSRKISGSTLLDRFSVIDNDSRKTAPYVDHRYSGFYYHLGKYVDPLSVMELGFNLGLLSCSFFTSCKSAKHFLGFNEISSNYVPLRLGKRNIRLVFKGDAKYYIGKLYDQEFNDLFSPNLWDLVIINIETVYDKHLECLDLLWPQMSDNGLIIAEYINHHIPAKDAFFAFCESKNRKPVLFETRYGTGILQK